MLSTTESKVSVRVDNESVSSLRSQDSNTCYIKISIAGQTLSLIENEQTVACYSVSTAKNGIGAMEGSGCTPLGEHVIAQKIGGDEPIRSVFVGRVPTGEIYDAHIGRQFPERDWILSRILWLSGCEVGVNQGSNESGCCDTYQRYIYIHGTPDTEPMGVPLSHGCIRMRNDDVVALYDQVTEGTRVIIIP
ncbi:L,D-transpeptidase [Psychrobacter sp. I-STPA6b]|uniref:L,D-transpeptidase n=1 Tax=Psychrobacter sp. I-STPA6b TaxID=2585718 RepID=UPI001D0CAA95|nr:L,D-transpeptidase [Psychrobacter sp. I-STPA6b]